jgi:S1-C subfamily serine protease
MNKLITALLLTLLLGGLTLAQDRKLSNATVDKADAETKSLIERVYPAFVLIGGGSGVCISDDGYFLTNHHVWTDAVAPFNINPRGEVESTARTVKMAGSSRRYVADAVGADPRGDIVLGKLRLGEGETAPHVNLGDSDKVEVGDICISIGNPFMLSAQGSEPTVTMGTVTATHRFQGGYNDAIQIDTAINPGNSGGPTFNLDGEVIGINGRNISSHGERFNTGAGFAIPSNQIRNFIPAMKAQLGGAHIVRHGLVGGLTPDMAYTGGARIAGVDAESQAADAGFEPGDVIVEVDGFAIRNAYRYYGVIGTKPRDSEFSFKVMRGDKDLTLTAINDVPTGAGQFETVPVADDRSNSRRTQFGLPQPMSTLGSGLKITYNTDRKVGGFLLNNGADSTPLASAGLVAADVLTHINGRRLVYRCDYNDIMIALKPGTEVTLRYLRAGREFDTKATTEKAPRRGG